MVEDKEYATVLGIDNALMGLETMATIPVVANMFRPLAITSALMKVIEQDYFCWDFTELVSLERKFDERFQLEKHYQRRKEHLHEKDPRLSSVLLGSGVAEGTRYIDSQKKGKFLVQEGAANRIIEEESSISSLMDDSIVLQSESINEMPSEEQPNKEAELARSASLPHGKSRNLVPRRHVSIKQSNEIKYISRTTLLKKDNPTVTRRPLKNHIFTAVYNDRLMRSLQKVVVSKNGRMGMRDDRLDRLRGIYFESSLGGTQHHKEERLLITRSREPASRSSHLSSREGRRSATQREDGNKYTYQPMQTPSSDVKVRVPTADQLKGYETRSQSGRVSIELRSVQQYSVEIRVKATEAHSVIVAIVPATRGPPSSLQLRDKDPILYSGGGSLLSQDIPKSSKRPVVLTFDNLRPNTTYRAYACVRYLNAHTDDEIFSSDEQILATSSEFTTLVENYDIEWTSLTEYMKEQEILAACQDVHVQRFAIAARVLIPSASKVRPSLIKSGSDFAVDSFISWWWGNRRGFVTKHRHDFLDREIEFVLKSDFFRGKVVQEGIMSPEEFSFLRSSFDDERNMEWLRFQQIVRNRPFLSFTADRREQNGALERSPSASQGGESEEDESISSAAEERGSIIDIGDGNDVMEVAADNSRKILENLYFKFRSWYKGGIEAYLARKSTIPSECSVSNSDHDVKGDLTIIITMASTMKERLIDRTALLAERTSLLKQCDERIRSLVELYKYDMIVLSFHSLKSFCPENITTRSLDMMIYSPDECSFQTKKWAL